MGHLFAIGPLETGEGPATAVCLVNDGLFTDVEIAPSASQALWRVRGRHRAEKLFVEPSLADAVPDLFAGIHVAPLPDKVKPMKLTLMLAMLHGGQPTAVHPDAWCELIEAATAFSHAAPWRFVDGDTALPIQIEQGREVEQRQISVMGQGDETFGVAIYRSGTIARMCRDNDPRVLMRDDSLALTLDHEPGWAREIVEDLLGASFVPCVMKVSRGRPSTPDDADVGRLVATLRAASKLSGRTLRTDHVHHTSRGDRIAVRIGTTGPVSKSATKPGKVGRNSPCPCGSGKKYKRCCLLAEQAENETASDAAPDDHVTPATEAVLEVLRRADPSAVHAFEAAIADSISMRPVLNVPLFVHEYELEPGVTPAQMFLRTRGSTLSRRQRETLEHGATGWLSLWEVLAIERGHGFEALDLLSGLRLTVRDVLASQSLQVRAVFLGRLIPGTPGVLDGVHEHTLGPDRVEDIVADARKALAVRTKQVDVAKLRSWSAARTLVRCWNDALSYEKPRVHATVRNTDGDPYEVTRDTYVVRGLDAGEVSERLLDDERTLEDEVDEDVDLQVTFTNFGNPIHPGWFRTTIGTATLEGDRLVVEANSPRRADEIRDRLARALSGHATFRERKTSPVKTVEATSEHGLMLDATPTSMLMADAELTAFREHLRQLQFQTHERLGGATPVEAVKKAGPRRELHRMLSELEYRAQDPAQLAEVALLRRRLGLADDGSRCKVDRIERELGFGTKASETLLDLAGPLMSEPLDETELEALLNAAEAVWNKATDTPELARDEAVLILATAGVSDSMAQRYADSLIERRSLFAGDLRIFEIAGAHFGRDANLQVITRAPANVHRRWTRARAEGRI